MNHVVRAIALSPDGRYLVTASKGATTQMWEATSSLRAVRLIHEQPLTSVAYFYFVTPLTK